MIEKPTSLSVNDFLIRRLSVKHLTDENIIAKIIEFQGKDANKSTHTNNEIEFSGFGKFIFNTKRAAKVLAHSKAKLERLKAIPEPRDKDKTQMFILESQINYIQSKL